MKKLFILLLFLIFIGSLIQISAQDFTSENQERRYYTPEKDGIHFTFLKPGEAGFTDKLVAQPGTEFNIVNDEITSGYYLTFQENGGKPGALELIDPQSGSTFTITNAGSKSRITYDPVSNRVFLNENSTADVNANGTLLKGISNASISVNSKGEVDFASFTSKNGGTYDFNYNGKRYSITANPGDNVVFNPKENKISASGSKDIGFGLNNLEAGKLADRQDTIKAKNWEAVLDISGNIKELKINDGGTFYDVQNKAEFSSKKTFSVFYDGRDIEKYDGNAISISNAEDVNKINAKGEVNVKDSAKNLFYLGLDKNTYCSYDKDTANFAVKDGKATIGNGKHQVSVNNGLVLGTDKFEFSDKASQFSVGFDKDGKTESISINYKDNNGVNQLEASYFKDGKSQSIKINDLATSEDDLSRRTQFQESDLSRKLVSEIDNLNREIASKKAKGEDVTDLIKQKDASELIYSQIKMNELVRIGDYDSAITEINSYLSQNRESEAAYTAKKNLGELYQAKEDYGKAIEIFKDLQNNPRNREDAGFALAAAYRQAGDPENAQATYFDMITKSSSDDVKSQAYLGLASNYIQKSDIRSSLLATEKVLELDPKNTVAKEFKKQLELRYIDGIRYTLSDEKYALQQKFEDYVGEHWYNIGVNKAFVNARDLGGIARLVGLNSGPAIAESEASNIENIISDINDQFTDQDIGLMFIQGLYRQGYDIQQIQKMSTKDISDIYGIPETKALKFHQGIQAAFKNPDVQNLASGAKQQFSFEKGESYVKEGELPSMIDSRTSTARKVANFFAQGPSLKTVATFVPFATVSSAGAFSRAGMFSTANSEMLLTKGLRVSSQLALKIPGAAETVESIGSGLSNAKSAFESTKMGNFYFTTMQPGIVKAANWEVPYTQWVDTAIEWGGTDIQNIPGKIRALKTASSLETIGAEKGFVQGSFELPDGGKINSLDFKTPEALQKFITENTAGTGKINVYWSNDAASQAAVRVGENEFLARVVSKPVVEDLAMDGLQEKAVASIAEQTTGTAAKAGSGISDEVALKRLEDLHSSIAEKVETAKATKEKMDQITETVDLIKDRYVITSVGQVGRVVGLDSKNLMIAIQDYERVGDEFKFVTRSVPIDSITGISSPASLADIPIPKVEVTPQIPEGAMQISPTRLEERITFWRNFNPDSPNPEILTKLADNAQRVTFPEFENTLKQTVSGEGGLNGVLSDGKPYVAVVGRGTPDKSPGWVYELSREDLARKPERLVHVTQTAEWSAESQARGLLDGGVKRIVIFDDASYSGTELSGQFLDPLDKILTTAKAKDVEIDVVCPYITDYAKQRVINFAKSSGLDVRLITSQKIPTIDSFLTPDEIAVWKPGNGQALTYFDHKVPDFLSFDSTLLTIIKGITPPYKDAAQAATYTQKYNAVLQDYISTYINP